MKKNKKYSYQDWWSGEICLEAATLEYNPTIIKTTPVRINWDGILKKDIPKIKKKQQQIFSADVKLSVEKSKELFLRRYTKSKMKNIFFLDELDQCNKIMFYVFDNYQQQILDKNWIIVFKNFKLHTIQQHIDLYIKKGETLTHDFVHSPHCIYQNKNDISCEVFAQACWDYREWLIDFGVKNKELIDETPITLEASPLQINHPSSTTDKIDSKANITSEIINPHLLIFKDDHAYKVFLELQKLTVKERSKISDYGCIYHKLKNKSIGIIKGNVRDKTFIAYLNEYQAAHLSHKVNKLPFKDPIKKIPIFRKILISYKKEVEK